MGCGSSNTDCEYRKEIKICHNLNLSKSDLDALWRYFKKADVNLDGTLCVEELCVQHEVQNASFGRLLFGYFDHDRSKTITFEEFCLCIWNVATLDESALPRFVFSIFDVDDSGSLTQEEVVSMIKVILLPHLITTTYFLVTAL